MAVRPVFVPLKRAPYVHSVATEFVWNAGLSAAQKKKNVIALHEAFEKSFPGKRILEISSKSQLELGVSLSAFNLEKYVPSIGRSIPVECVYQGGKVFSKGGPFTDMYEFTARAAKKDQRLKESGKLCGFYYEGESLPLEPMSAFYNWLYINALIENPELSERLAEFDGFTDIEFAPDKGVSCQAAAAAVFVSLRSLGLLEECRDFESFRRMTV